MNLTNAEKVRILISRKKVTLTEIADLLGMTRQNLYKKMEKDNFSKEELERIASHLNITYESSFILEDGSRI